MPSDFTEGVLQLRPDDVVAPEEQYTNEHDHLGSF